MVAYPKSNKPSSPRLTPQEYLERERKAQTKSEYLDGVVVAMTGASKEHNRITVNIVSELHAQLKESSCEPFAADMRVRVPQENRYYYPDIVVVCGEPQFEESALDTLLNPTLIVEVLSESTEAKDRGEKFEDYKTLSSLKTHILVAQDRPHIEIFRRQERADWHASQVEGLGGRLFLDEIGCRISLADVYARVTIDGTRG